MSARFVTNFLVLLFGAGAMVCLFAFGRPTADWISVGAGGGAIILALWSFACREQGVYQRIADPLIAVVGGWAIVAARAMDSRGIWLLFSAAAALLGLGVVGLIVRELDLGIGLTVGESKIGPDEYARLANLQRTAESHP